LKRSDSKERFVHKLDIAKNHLNETHGALGVATNPPTSYRVVNMVVMALLYTIVY